MIISMPGEDEDEEEEEAGASAASVVTLDTGQETRADSLLITPKQTLYGGLQRFDRKLHPFHGANGHFKDPR